MSEELMTLRALMEKKLKNATEEQQKEITRTCEKMRSLLDYQYDTAYPRDALEDNYQLIYLTLYG